jgi:haloalkane dehalogenase
MAAPILTEAERRLSLAPGAFPFESRFVATEGARLHYVDVGQGPLALMLHGNPTWSALYRQLILGLAGECRCVAVDLAGFGLSTPPPGFSFRAADHARLIAAAIERLDLRDATLVAHDWGGPVGLGAAAATGRIARLCLGNTWAWPVNGDFHFEWFSKLMGGPLGRFGAERYCVFVNLVMPTSMRRRKLGADEMQAFRAPFRGLQARRGMHVFPAEIIAASAFLADCEAFVQGFKGPAAFIWPERDIAFRDKELARWRSLLPQAEVARLPNCGHFLWLDAPDECLAAVRGFMRKA